jgi:hypothetical protein
MGSADAFARHSTLRILVVVQCVPHLIVR